MSSSGTSWEECTAYIYGNVLEVANWRQQKDKIIINLKGPGAAAAAGGIGGVSAITGGAPLNDDAKTKLNQFCQKKCRSVITKNDVVYTNEQVQDDSGSPGYQSSVTLNCLDGISFAGAVCADKKGAEKSAAQEALNHYADELDIIATAPKKRKTGEATGGAAEPAVPKEPSPFAQQGCESPKSQLNQALSKILRKPLSKTDVVYETEKIEGVGFQSTIKLPCMPDEWASMSWAGEAFAKKTDAEHSAASIACAALKDYSPGA